MKHPAMILAAFGSAACAAALPAPALCQTVDGRFAFDVRAEGSDSEVAIVFGDWRERVLSSSSWTVRVSTPLQTGASSGDFITDGGLRGSTAVRASYNWILHGEPFPYSERRRLVNQAIEACQAERMNDDGSTPCSDRAYSELAQYLTPSEEERLRPRKVNVVLVGLSAGAGHQSLDFRDSATLAERSVTETPYALSGSVGGEFGAVPFDHYLGFGVEHTREYRGSDERTLCAPMPTTGPQECFTASYGEPRAQDTTAAYFIGRVQGEDFFGLGLPYAVEVQPAYDFESDVSEVATTLFLLPDGDGRLRGGLRFRWRSADDDPTTDDDHFTVGAFVGVPFSLYAPAGNR